MCVKITSQVCNTSLANKIILKKFLNLSVQNICQA